jgi:hypothetical protein
MQTENKTVEVTRGRSKKLLALLMTVALILSVMTVTAFASTTAPTIDLTGVDLGGILDGVVSMIPQVMPVLVGFLAIRKGISFLMSSLRGA